MEPPSVKYDLVIENKPGTRIRHADALWIHVGFTLEGHTSKEKILAEQSKDHFCKAQKLKILSNKTEYFLDVEGVLYKRSWEHKHQLVVPKSLVKDIMKANHNPVYTGHPEWRQRLILSLYITRGPVCRSQ